MGFFYISVFSLIFIAFVYGAALLMFWFIWTKSFGRKFSGPAVWVIAALILVAPWAEEIWIAWTFGQLCKKDAGLFINKTVDVDGFYDATMRSAYENTRQGGYRFVEQPTQDRRRVERVERADDSMRKLALDWYARMNPGKERPKDRSIFYPLSADETIAVLPNGVDAWKVSTLDKPTARYQYKNLRSHSPVAYRMKAFEWVVEDTESNAVIAREIAYAREPYWFYIGLERPTMFCSQFGDSGEKLSGGLYRLALQPMK